MIGDRRKIEKHLLLGVIRNGDDMEDEEWARFTVLEDLRLADSRWSANHCLTFEFEGACYELFYSRGLTEQQDEQPLQDAGYWIEVEEVADPRQPGEVEEAPSGPPAEGEFWVHYSDVASRGSEILRDLKASLEGEPNVTPAPWGSRCDWPCGSFFEAGLLPAGPEGFASFRVAWKVRQGAVSQKVFELSPWTRPAAADSVPLAEVSLSGVFSDHPFGDPRGTCNAHGSACDGGGPTCLAGSPSPQVVFKLSERAHEVLGDLDGARKWAREAKECPACVVCVKGIMEGDLYEHQKDKTSPRRRVHVSCLRQLGRA